MIDCSVMVRTVIIFGPVTFYLVFLLGKWWGRRSLMRDIKLMEMAARKAGLLKESKDAT